MSGIQPFPVFVCPVFRFLLYFLISYLLSIWSSNFDKSINLLTSLRWSLLVFISYLFSIWPSNFDKSINVSYSWNVIGNERFETSLQLNGLRGVTDNVVKQLLHLSLKTELNNLSTSYLIFPRFKGVAKILTNIIFTHQIFFSSSNSLLGPFIFKYIKLLKRPATTQVVSYNLDSCPFGWCYRSSSLSS